MRKSWLALFVIEFSVFILTMYFFDMYYIDFPDILYVSKSLVFGLIWFYVYKTLRISEYYRHVFKICMLYFIFILSLMISLDKNLDTFFLNFYIIISWAFLSYIIRAISLKYGAIKTIVLCAENIIDDLCKNKKVKLQPFNKVTLKDLMKCDVLVVESFDISDMYWQRIISHAQALGVKVLTLREYNLFAGGKFMLRELQNDWLATSLSKPKIYAFVKRTWELILITLFLPLIIFVIFISAIVILITMGRPIFFIQERVGLSGNVFRMYKFRTMRQVKGFHGETAIDDVRITCIGKLLRKFRLDELPQVLNVYKNEMSLIGPRPEWSETAGKFADELDFYNLRNIVKPGISGWAQVMQGHATGAEGNFEKLQYDLYYIRHFSFSLDALIFFKTLITLFTGSGAK